MNTIKATVISCMVLFLSSATIWAGPTQMTDSQMTDMSVDDTVVSPDAEDENTLSPNAKLDAGKKPGAVGALKNPVDNPLELNQPEMLNLEKQAADQRVNDQIQQSLQGVNNNP